MPIYEYECTKCNHLFDLKQGFEAETTAPCPLCSLPSKRRFHPPAVIYKGSGFYTTDYARKEVHHDSDKDNAGSKDKDNAGSKSEPEQGNTTQD